MRIVLAYAGVAVERAIDLPALREEPALRAELTVGCLRAGLLWLLAQKRSVATWATVEAELIAFILAGLGQTAR